MAFRTATGLLSACVLLGGCAPVGLRPRSAECTAAVLVGAGCAPLLRADQALDDAAKRFSPTPGKAQIYVVRPSIVGGQYLWDVQIDGRAAGQIAEHTYLLLEVEPGPHTLTAVTAENQHALVVQAAPGANSFIEAMSRMGWTQSKAELRALDQTTGMAAVRASRLVALVASAPPVPSAPTASSAQPAARP